MTAPMQSDDPIAPLLLPPGPRSVSLPVHYRTGLLVAWNPATGENEVVVDGLTLTDVPVIPGPWMTVVETGDRVSLLSTVDAAGISTAVILGPAMGPGDPRLAPPQDEEPTPNPLVFVAAASNTGSVTTSFTEVLTFASGVVWRSGGAWEINIGGGGLSTSTSSTMGNFVLNYVPPGGEVNLYDFGWFGPEHGTNPANVTGRGVVVNTGPTVVSTSLKLYLRANTGTVNWLLNPGTADVPRYLEVREIGDAADYPTARQIP